MKRVNGAALERLDGILDEAGLVQRVEWIITWTFVVVGDVEAVVDRGRRRAPVLMQLQRTGAGVDHFHQRRPAATHWPLPEMPRLHRKRIERLIMRAMCQGPGVQVVANVPCDGPVPPPSIEVTAGHQRVLDLLRADEMDVAVEPARGEDLALARV